MTLYRDPTVRFGGMDVGGIRVSHLSDIAKPLTVVLAVSKGKRAPYVVKPLADAPPPAPAPAPNPNGITPGQLTALNAHLTQDLDLTERADKLAYLSGALGREIASSKDLTKAEASRLLDALPAPEPTLPDGAA
jgi:hypothetical protein